MFSLNVKKISFILMDMSHDMENWVFRVNLAIFGFYDFKEGHNIASKLADLLALVSDV